MTARADRDAANDLEEAAYAAESTKLDRLSARASAALLAAATDAGDLDRARHWQRSAEAAVARLGADAGEARAELSARTAWLELKSGDVVKAETQARAAVADGCKGEVTTLATCSHLDVLATVLAARGKRPEALELYQKNLALVTAQYGVDHPTTARSTERVATTLDKLGRHDEALALFDRTLQQLPEGSGVRALVLENSATALMSLGKLPAAETRMRAGLQIQERLLGPDHTEVATTLVNLANVLELEGKDALPLRERALEILETKLGPDHPLVASALTTLAYHHVAAKQPALAIPLLERAAKIQLAALGKAHPDYAYTLNILGAAELDAKDPRAVATIEAAIAAPGTAPAALPDLKLNLADAKRLHFSRL